MFRNKKFTNLTVLILILALILRLRGFTSHFLLGSDTARDLLVAKGALVLGELPTVGSFSSSGPFVFAPNWYWFLMVPIQIFPDVFLAPWLLLLALSLLSVFFIILAGTSAVGRKLGLVTGLVMAVSPIASGYATYLTQHGLVQFFSVVAILGFVAFIKTKKLKFAFLMSLALGCGLSLHYQVLNLLVLIPLTILIDLRKLLPLILIMGTGLLLPLISLLWWDAHRGFQNTLHLVGYFRVGQFQIYVPNRWLTYIGVFWTTFLGKIFGGSIIPGSFLGLLLGIVSLVAIIRRKMPKAIFWLLIAFVIQFVVFRYFRGERYEGYVIYFHGILYLLIGWTFYELCKLNKIIGFTTTALFIFLSIAMLVPLQDQTNDVPKLFAAAAKLDPKVKYSVYAKDLPTSNCTFAFSWVVESKKMGDDKGFPLGVCKSSDNSCQVEGESFISELKFQGDRCVVVRLPRKPENWYNFSKEAVFDDVQNWWRKEDK